MHNWRNKRAILSIFLCLVLLLVPVLTVAASDSAGDSSAAYGGIDTTRSDKYLTKSITYNGLTTTIKGLTKKNYSQVLNEFSKNIPASIRSGKPYKVKDQSFIDAEKYSATPSNASKYSAYENGYDALLCWASSAANMLWLSGYASEAKSPLTKKAFKNEDEVFDYFRKCFADFGGDADKCIKYFLKGTYKTSGRSSVAAQLREDAPKGGLLKKMFKKADLKKAKDSKGLSILGMLDNLAGVSASIEVDYFTKKDNMADGVHALTLIGIVKDERETDIKKKYKGVILADSDNTPVTSRSASKDSPEEKARKAALTPNIYTFYPLKHEKVNGEDRWEIVNYCDDSKHKALIRSVLTMKNMPSESGAEDSGSQDETNTKKKVKIKQTPLSVKTEVKKNKVTVSWKKIRNTEKNSELLTQIKGIQVQYATDPGFLKNRKTKSVGKKSTSVVLTLKTNTTYYIRLRYIGKDCVSKWTNLRKVITKG